MPLVKGSSRAAIAKNIHELTVNGSRPRSHAEVVAIALAEADKARHRRASGGGTSEDSGLTADQIYKRNAPYVRKGKKRFNTALSPDRENLFQSWTHENHVPFRSDDPQSDYDMRGFWLARQAGDSKAKSAVDPNDRKLHYPDNWKTPYDATFSNQSQWATSDAPHWTDDDQLIAKDGTVVFDDRKRRAFGGGGLSASGNMGGGMGSGGLGGNMNANLGPTTPTVPSIGQAHTMPMPTVPRATLADGGAPAAEQAASLNEPYHQSGFIHSDVAGRTDRLPMTVPADSFVFPADCLSSLGQGNSLAGAKIMNAILDGAGPYGTRVRQRRAAGGMTGTGVSQVMLAGGELTADPNQLRNIGYRRRKAGTPNPPKDLAEGHKWAREMVDRLRAHQKKFLRTAPSPKR